MIQTWTEINKMNQVSLYITKRYYILYEYTCNEYHIHPFAKWTKNESRPLVRFEAWGQSWPAVACWCCLDAHKSTTVGKFGTVRVTMPNISWVNWVTKRVRIWLLHQRWSCNTTSGHARKVSALGKHVLQLVHVLPPHGLVSCALAPNLTSLPFCCHGVAWYLNVNINYIHYQYYSIPLNENDMGRGAMLDEP